jgi:hypothetical protein
MPETRTTNRFGFITLDVVISSQISNCYESVGQACYLHFPGFTGPAPCLGFPVEFLRLYFAFGHVDDKQGRERSKYTISNS